MSMIDRGLDGMALLSGHLGAMLRRRLREFGGIALLSLAMMAALALATWSVHDPSLSHATDARVHNLLGRPGAIAADLMMQLLGLGSLALLLPVGIWGYRLLGHRAAWPRTAARDALDLRRFAHRGFCCVPPARCALAVAIGARWRRRRRHTAGAGHGAWHAASWILPVCARHHSRTGRALHLRRRCGIHLARRRRR